MRKALLALVALLAAFAAFVSTRPADFRVERSADLAAPAPVVFGLVNDFHQWTRWSPWEGRDPNLHRTYSGSPSGLGATYAWEGTREVGAGRMTITDSKPPERLHIRLEFLKPFETTNR